MRKIFYLYIVLLFIMACQINKKEEYKIPQLSQRIQEFIKSKDYLEYDSRILLVNLDVKNDTLELIISNSYPNIKKLKFRCDTSLYGWRTIFTGEKIEGFCNTNLLANSFPKDIVDINVKQKWILWNEFTSWLFVFKNDRLVYKDLGGKIE